MQHDEKLSIPLVKNHLDILTKSFLPQAPVSEKALSILFNANLYGEVIREIKLKMNLPCTIGIRTYEDDKFPIKTAAGFIGIPSIMPMYGSTSFENLKLELSIRKSLRSNYYKFGYVSTHEMAHVCLYSRYHSLRESEIATDLLVIVMGFGQIMLHGRKDCGYLDDFHFNFAMSYFQKILQEKRPGTYERQPFNFDVNFSNIDIDNIFKGIDDLFKNFQF